MNGRSLISRNRVLREGPRNVPGVRVRRERKRVGLRTRKRGSMTSSRAVAAGRVERSVGVGSLGMLASSAGEHERNGFT